MCEQFHSLHGWLQIQYKEPYQTFSQRKPANLAIKLHTNHVLRVRRHGDWRMWCEEGRPLVAHSMMYPAEKVMCCYGREKECAEVRDPRSSWLHSLVM